MSVVDKLDYYEPELVRSWRAQVVEHDQVTYLKSGDDLLVVRDSRGEKSYLFIPHRDALVSAGTKVLIESHPAHHRDRRTSAIALIVVEDDAATVLVDRRP